MQRIFQPCLPITVTFYNNKTFTAVHCHQTAYHETLTDKCGKFLCFNSACFFGITCQLTIFVWKCSFSLHISFLLVSSQLLIRFTILVNNWPLVVYVWTSLRSVQTATPLPLLFTAFALGYWVIKRKVLSTTSGPSLNLFGVVKVLRQSV